MTASKPKRVILWCAVSSEEQATEDKDSIDDQLKRQRARAEANGWQIVDTIIINGFSRRYFTYLEFAQAAAKDFPAAMRMYAHWDAADFDILSLRDLSRIGREQSILSEFISRTIAAGAIIAPLDEAILDSTNYRMMAAIGGVGASVHVDNLIRYREMGMQKRTEKGLRQAAIPRFYVDIVDEKHKSLGIRPDREHYQRFFDDFASAYVNERLSYKALGDYLYNQYGHVDPLTNRPYKPHIFMTLLYHPATWGHSVWGMRRKAWRYAYKNQFWVTGDEPPPPGVSIYRDVIEPIWQSPTKERIKAELHFRHYTMKGRMIHRTHYLYSGLLVCPVCGSYFGGVYKVTKYGQYMYYRCDGLFGSTPPKECTNRLYIPEHVVTDWLKPRLEQAYIGRSLDNLLPSEQPPTTDLAAALAREMTETEAAILNLTRLLLTQGEHTARVMQAELDAYNERMGKLISQYNVATSQTFANEQTLIDRQQALNEFQAMHLDEFWAQEPSVINRWLHRILGNARMAVLDREVSRFVEARS